MEEHHRSKFETNFKALCTKEGFDLGYEKDVLPFVTPPENRKYHPDWTIKPGWFIETKGLFTSADRKKTILVREQHPEARILIVFLRSKSTLSKKSKTTYAQWSEKNKIEWCSFEDTDKIFGFIREALGT